MMKMDARRPALLVVTLGFAFAGCGVAPQEEPLPIASPQAALADNGGGTTRDVCKACGCVASDVACDCGAPPGREKLDCIDNGGPAGEVSQDGIATSPGRTAARTSASAQPALRLPDPPTNPACPAGQVQHCTVGPPPVCWCSAPTVGAFAL